MREIRATLGKCLENGRSREDLPHPALPAYRSLDDMPELYSGSFGLGSRDLQPEGLVAAVENMLPDGAGRRHYYLSIDFVHDEPRTPKQALHQEALLEAYPDLKELALHGSENPNLMPEGSVTVRFHSVGGWGAITTGKNLAMILYELLDYHIKANPKYGSEKKGQPTTYYLSAAPEPIRVNCEYFYVDTVLSPDPNVLHHTNALAGLKDGGIFVIQSDQGTPERVWAKIPIHYQQEIADRDIRVFFVDAFRIAREVATDADLQLRMQGIAFQGAFFAASPLMEEKDLTEETLLEAIRGQLQRKFGEKGARVVQENLEVVRRGYDELQEIVDKPVGVQALEVSGMSTQEPALPEMVKRLPAGNGSASDIHRYWEQTGSFYARGEGNDNLADPFMGLGTMPAASSLFRDMSGIRFEHPRWIGENCTACGDCYTVCPDTAIPGLVNEIQQVLDTAVARLKKAGHEIAHLPRATRALERKLRALLSTAEETDAVNPLLEQGMAETLAEYDIDAAERPRLEEEFSLLREAMGSFQFALSRPFFTLQEKDRAGSGGLLSITVDPYRCKGCMECVAVCADDALVTETQTDDSEAELKRNWDFWLDLPTTPSHYQTIEDLEEGAGALHTLLLDKQAYLALSSGDGACLGCSEKTVIHLFVATVTALMQRRVRSRVEKITNLLQQLEEHVRLRLMEAVDVEDAGAISDLLTEHGSDLTLADVAGRMEELRGEQPIDTGWLQRVNGLIAGLKDLKWRYEQGVTGGGRADMGMLNATGCTSVWGSTWPYNPYPFPWSNHLFQDTASLALGVFEGHMAKMAAGFATVRRAELELAGKYVPAEHDEFFARFDWQQFSDEEFKLCPPVVAVGGDGAMYDIGFQNLSRAMMSGKPIKVLVVDTQVYSNTGGQACTSGFIGQVSDMAAFGKANPGKTEVRKEIGLIGMAHRTTYVMQSSIAHASHMIEGFIEGLQARRPALFNLYTACQPEHGIGDDAGYQQAKLAVESRAYPLFRYDPERGVTPQECFDLDGNPALFDTWPTYDLTYLEGGREKTLSLPLCFADFAMTEGRFRKHFRQAPPDTWHDDMIPMVEYLELDGDEREGKVPFLWTVDGKQRLSRLLADQTMVASCEERRDFWLMLKAIARAEPEPRPEQPDVEGLRRDIVGNIASGLMQLAGGEADLQTLLSAAGEQAPALEQDTTPAVTPDTQEQAGAQTKEPAAGGDYMAPWLDTDECTACDECTNLNDRMFAYNDAKKAYIKDPDAGPYRDLVKAAEKCTARVIHPGLPRDRSDKDILKWIKRGEKFN
jgi:pyruvate-ferredoxin/flavodoxin oxidoreductase